jgi:peptidoglycan hydrolase-like protein with peptidoglycan-binding domain
MPIRRYLDEHRFFDAETVRLLGIAFETAVAAFQQMNGVEADPPRDAIAKVIIESAKTGERDPDPIMRGSVAGAAVSRPAKRTPFSG